MKKAIIGLAVGLFALATVGVASAQGTPQCDVSIAWKSNTYDVKFQIGGSGFGHMVRVDGLGVSPIFQEGEPVTFIFPYTVEDAGDRHAFSARVHNANGSDRCLTTGHFHVKE